MGPASPEVDEEVVEDALLQGLLVAVHELGLAADELVRVVGRQLVDDGVGQRTDDQDGSRHKV